MRAIADSGIAQFGTEQPSMPRTSAPSGSAGDVGQRRDARAAAPDGATSPVAARRLAQMHRRRQHAGVLARAVVVQLRRRLAGRDAARWRPKRRAAHARRSRAHRGSSPARSSMAAARCVWRSVPACEPQASAISAGAEAEAIGRAGLDQRQRLQRLHRRARIDRPVDVAQAQRQRPRRRGDRDGAAVPALDQRPARHLDEDGIGHVLAVARPCEGKSAASIGRAHDAIKAGVASRRSTLGHMTVEIRAH